MVDNTVSTGNNQGMATYPNKFTVTGVPPDTQKQMKKAAEDWALSTLGVIPKSGAVSIWLRWLINRELKEIERIEAQNKQESDD